MAEVMIAKYTKYWDNVNGLMGMATILDPRYKMALIHFYFSKIFDDYEYDKEVKRISDLLHSLVDEYASRNGRFHASSSQQPFNFGSNDNGAVFMPEFKEFLEKDKGNSQLKSDLDKYLGDENAPLVDNFNILNWWKTNGGSYPILQQVARDILSIPISTVPSESEFSISGRVLEPHRSRLLPETLEALVCAQNWIWASLKASGEFKEKEFAKLVEDLEEESIITDLGTNDKISID